MVRHHALALRIGLALACAVLAGGAMAQTPLAFPRPAPPGDANRAMALDDLPIDAARLALGQRLATAVAPGRLMDDGLDQWLKGLRASVWTDLLAIAPNADRTRLAAALDEALAAHRADILARQTMIFSRYYALRMTPTALAEAATFYETPLGQKSARTPEAMTDADRAAMNRYVEKHPAVLDELPTRLAALDLGLQVLQREQDDMALGFKVRLCRSLKLRGEDLPSCKAFS